MLEIINPQHTKYEGIYSFCLFKIECVTFFRTVFVTLLSETVRPTKLKFGTHIDNGWMHHFYRNWAVGAYSSLYFSFFFLSNFQTLKIFVTLFRNCEASTKLKLGTHLNNSCMYCVYQNQTAAAYLSLYFFVFHSKFSNIKIFVTLFSGTFRPTKLKLGTHADSRW